MNRRISTLTFALFTLAWCVPRIASGNIHSVILSECSYYATGNQEECPAVVQGTRVTTGELQRESFYPPPLEFLPGPTQSNISASYFSARWREAQIAGHSAGDTFENIGVWLSAYGNVLENHFFFTPWDSSSRGVQAGIDFTPTELSSLGISIGYNNTDVNTPFNAGQQDVDTLNFTLYGALALSEVFSVDALFGYADINTDQSRFGTGAFGDPFAFGTNVTSDVDASRFYGGLNLNAFTNLDHLLLAAQAGYLYSETDQDSFTETGGGTSATVAGETFVLSQWHVAANIGYDFGTFLEPYVGVDYTYDISREEVLLPTGLQQPANDRSEMLVRLGMRYFGDNGVSAALEWSTNALRQDIDSNTLMLNLRLDL